MKAPLRTKSIGTKVSEEEFAALEATARAADMTLSEWVRAVLLAAPGVELPDDDAALAGRVAVAEVLALRTLLLNLFFRATKGEAIPEPEMRALIERADRVKGERARERIEAARSQARKQAGVPAEKPEAEEPQTEEV
jgi:Mobilization protein NikA